MDVHYVHGPCLGPMRVLEGLDKLGVRVRGEEVGAVVGGSRWHLGPVWVAENSGVGRGELGAGMGKNGPSTSTRHPSLLG